MIPFHFNAQSKLPLYAQLYQSIRREITSGRLRAGDRLPSKRQLAAHLSISRNTVETAYQQLAAEGYLRARERSGYFVEQVRFSQPFERSLAPSLPESDHAVCCEFDLRTGRVDTQGFPFSTWSRLNRQVLSLDSQVLLEGPPPQGIYALRQEISNYLAAYRGVKAAPEQVVIGAGSEYLLHLIVLLLGRDRVYAVEDPGYEKTRSILAGSARVRPLPLDEEGLRIDALRGSDASVIHVTPSHHFPLGMVMPVSRRMELLTYLNEGDRYLIEDDYDSEFRFSGRPIPSMQGMDDRERVIYFNTFAKSLAPSLRISYMVLPPHLLEVFHQKFRLYASTVPSFEQLTLQRFMAGGHFERHLNRMRKQYRLRRDALIQALKDNGLTSILTLSGQEAGLHLIMRVNNGMGEKELLAAALKQGVYMTGLSDHCVQIPAEKATLLAGYAGLPQDKAPETARRLRKAWMDK